jgi:hypothetical protein
MAQSEPRIPHPGVFYLTRFSKTAARLLERVRGGRSGLGAPEVEAEAFPAPWPSSGQFAIICRIVSLWLVYLPSVRAIRTSRSW